jgi:hypothetical protein
METRKPFSRPLSQSEGFAHIKNYYCSGLRSRDYYKQHGISEWQFYQWRKRYLAVHPQADSPFNAEKKFHRIQIESTSGICISGIEIHYPHGVRVVISQEHPMEIETLSALIKLCM